MSKTDKHQTQAKTRIRHASTQAKTAAIETRGRRERDTLFHIFRHARESVFIASLSTSKEVIKTVSLETLLTIKRREKRGEQETREGATCKSDGQAAASKRQEQEWP